MGSLAAAEDINSKSPLLTLPNELLLEVAPHLERFRDLNSLLRTSRFFRTLFHTLLYRRAITANDTVRDDIVLWVLSKYRIASLQHLLDNGLSFNYKFSDGEDLLDDGFSVNYKFSDGKDMLRTLCWLDKERSVPLARLLLERGVDVRAKDAYSETVLHEAARHNSCGIATLLLAHGADINAACRDGWTPLHHAVQDDRRDFVLLLLAHGAAVNARSPVDGCTPLLAALSDFNTDVIPVLLAHGADVTAHDTQGRTALHMASRYFPQAKHSVANLLLEHGADVNAIDYAGLTPLHCITSEDDPDFLWDEELFMPQFLLENGAAVNTVANNGCTPIEEAISNSALDLEYKVKLVALLLAHGAC